MPVRIDHLELGVTRACIVSLCWIFPTALFTLGVLRSTGTFDDGKNDLGFWQTMAFLPGILGTSVFATMVLRRLVNSPVQCFTRKSPLILASVWLLNPMTALLIGTVLPSQALRELCCVPLLLAMMGLCSNRKMCDCQRRYSFRRRVDITSGLILRENEWVMWAASRFGLLILPLSLLNMQLSLYGAACDAPEPQWHIISKMAALGLGFSTLILAKFIAVIVTVGQGMDTRCTPFLIARVVFFLFLFSADWVCMKLLMLKKSDDPSKPDDDATLRAFTFLRLALVILSYASGCMMLILTVSPTGRFVVKRLADLLTARGLRRRGQNGDGNIGDEAAPVDPSTQFLIAAEPFNSRKYTAQRKGVPYEEKSDGKKAAGGLGGSPASKDDDRSASSPRESLVSTAVGGGLDTVSELDSVIVDDGTESERSNFSPDRNAAAGAGKGKKGKGKKGKKGISSSSSTEMRDVTSPLSSPRSEQSGSPSPGRSTSGGSQPSSRGARRESTENGGGFRDSDGHLVRIRRDANPNLRGRRPNPSLARAESSEHVIRRARPKRLIHGPSSSSASRPRSDSGSSAGDLGHLSGNVTPTGMSSEELAKLAADDPKKQPLLFGSGGGGGEGGGSAAGSEGSTSTSGGGAPPTDSVAGFLAADPADLRNSPNLPPPATSSTSGPGAAIRASAANAVSPGDPLSATQGSSDSQGSEEPPMCTICLTEFDEGEMVRSMPHCDHLFHAACLEKWARTQGSTCLCPMCRRPAFTDKGNASDCLASLEAQDVREQISSEESQGLILRSRPLAQSLNVDILIAALCVRILENDIQSAAHVLLEHKPMLERLQTRRRVRIDSSRRPVLETWADGIIAAHGCLDASVKNGLMMQLQGIEWDDDMRNRQWETLTDPQKTTVYSLMLGDVIDRLNGE